MLFLGCVSAMARRLVSTACSHLGDFVAPCIACFLAAGDIGKIFVVGLTVR
jgi:hypothetical protein